jgi:hypothetical protein
VNQFGGDQDGHDIDILTSAAHPLGKILVRASLWRESVVLFYSIVLSVCLVVVLIVFGVGCVY